MLITALYLAHLNPVTDAHVEIIQDLIKKANMVKVMPVVFKDNNNELNSRSFPFDYNTRKRMLESVFDDTIRISDDYTFEAPFKKYIPPIISKKSWLLRSNILNGVQGGFFSYTGDKSEGIMLRLYRLRPQVGRRRPISATSVKSLLYKSAANEDAGSWESHVPKPVANIIHEKWETVCRFAASPDETMRVLGMKFPKKGW